MKFTNVTLFVLAGLFTVSGISGCVTDDEGGSSNNTSAGLTGNVKTQGVYTTLALSNEELDMSASEALQKSSFGPGEKPAAVITGYGNADQLQMVTLELIESDTGRSLMSKNYYMAYGKVMIQPLAIRLGGNYELKLTSGEAALDTWQFTVARTNSSGDVRVNGANAGANYAEGDFSVSVDTDNGADLFSKYDDKLGYTMVNTVANEAGSITNEDLFAQRLPGKTVIQCRMDSQGHLSEPKILENTMDDECGALFQKILMERSPYDAWPDDVHQKFGSDDRELTLTINLD